MTSDSTSRSDTCHQLGVLAMRFRRTSDEMARRGIAAEYAREVQRLIETGSWTEAPAFEDQLPDEWMPEVFFAYWCPESPPEPTAKK
jgi:mono/diheme cytochrome c family protein